jgi:hypothetical protein
MVSAGLLISVAGTSMAYDLRHHRYSLSPGAIAERQRHAPTRVDQGSSDANG